jgi:hypothetical protein
LNEYYLTVDSKQHKLTICTYFNQDSQYSTELQSAKLTNHSRLPSILLEIITMKTSQLLATVLMTAGALVSFSSMASAGEGGAAGSVSVIMGGGAITNLSAAAAVGKLNAAAVTHAGTSETFASAYGSAGVITVTNAGMVSVGYVGAVDTTIGTAQANTLAPATLATIKATTGEVTIP